MNTMKKMLMVFVAFTLFFTLFSGFANDADARRGGGFKSSPKSYTTTPKKSTDSNSSTMNSTNRSKNTTAGSTANRGFFSGGSFFKGLMIGGLAGMLFGGMFGNMGMFGDLLGLVINLFAIYILFIAARGIYRMIRQRKKSADPYNRR